MSSVVLFILVCRDRGGGGVRGGGGSHLRRGVACCLMVVMASLLTWGHSLPSTAATVVVVALGGGSGHGVTVWSKSDLFKYCTCEVSEVSLSVHGQGTNYTLDTHNLAITHTIPYSAVGSIGQSVVLQNLILPHLSPITHIF